LRPQPSSFRQTPEDADENSIDNLLNLFGSPQQQPVAQPKLHGQATAAPFSPGAKPSASHTIHYATNRPTTFFGDDLGSKGPHAAFEGGCEGSGLSSPFDSPSSHGSGSTGAGRKFFAQDSTSSFGALPSAIGQPSHASSAGSSSGTAFFGPLASLQGGGGGKGQPSAQLFPRGASTGGAPRSINSLQDALGAGAAYDNGSGVTSSQHSSGPAAEHRFCLPAAGGVGINNSTATSVPTSYSSSSSSSASAGLKQRYVVCLIQALYVLPLSP
jgi:hypothetical protein